MKQTAVEWLIEELKALDWWYLPNSIKKDIFYQAKTMEKEQIVKAFEHVDFNLDDGEHYYEQTYEKKKD